MFHSLLRPALPALLLWAGFASTPAWAQDDGGPLPGLQTRKVVPRGKPPAAEEEEEQAPAPSAPQGSSSRRPAEPEPEAGDGEAAPLTVPGATTRNKPPALGANATVSIDFVDTPLNDLVKFMAEITGRNFILTDELKGNVTIISHKPVSAAEAYEAFLSALEMSGYTTVTVGEATKVVATSGAANSPLRVYQNGEIPYTDNYVTQIIQLENVNVSDISSVVKDLAGKGAKIIAYAPTNTLIITDAATNIRRVYKIISQLDVAAPKAKMEIIPLSNAPAEDIQRIIEQLYGTESSSSSSSSSSEAPASGGGRRKRRSALGDSGGDSASSTNVGAEGRYIQKIISDERTNSLIVMANDEAMTAVKDLIARLDVDVDPSSRAQIHVIYLEHAKAEDVAQVLSQLSETSSKSSSSSNRNRRTPGASGGRSAGEAARGGAAADTGSESSAVAAFESGVKITHDENTNSLVMIATPDQISILRQVIEKLDIRRKQVFVECVILEMADESNNTTNLGFHVGVPGTDGSLTVLGSDLGASSLNGLTNPDILSGMAVGVAGQSIDVPVSGLAAAAAELTGGDGDSASSSTISVPAFGVILQALQTTTAVNIISTPNLLTMDNEEAKIVVGRNVPFPVSSGLSTSGQQINTYQREDVAITLKVTPQINESNYVTLEVFQEVQEVEEGQSASSTQDAGPVTSKRQIESTVVVRDNQTIVIGGLIGETTSKAESKIPVLGDLPLIGRLFRGEEEVSRKSNMLVFLTPHIIDEPADLEEVYRVKWAQRQEFIRRFYGKSRDQQETELMSLLAGSFNQIDRASPYRGPSADNSSFQTVQEDSTTAVKATTDEQLLDQMPSVPSKGK